VLAALAAVEMLQHQETVKLAQRILAVAGELRVILLHTLRKLVVLVDQA
tara:strand:- start:39 stop:185 length:147 start_codon:yes stop_codon:yes gene_type:complete